MLGMSRMWIIRKCSGVYIRWTIIPPCLGWSLAVSLSQKVPVSAQLLQISQCLSVKYLTALAGRSWNKSYGSRGPFMSFLL